MAGIELGDIPLNGRSMAEYMAMFGLESRDLLAGPVLDAAAGPASFAAEAAVIGARVTAVDPAYALPAERIIALSMAQIANIREKIEPVAGGYRWDYYKDPEDLRRRREQVTRQFGEDFAKGSAARRRYVAGQLPHLPFRDGAFRLALSSHFLFLFSDRLDRRFHLASLLELARVARERVLVYPVVGLDAKPFPAMDDLLADLKSHGVNGSLVATGFEFLKGATHALELKMGCSASG